MEGVNEPASPLSPAVSTSAGSGGLGQLGGTPITAFTEEQSWENERLTRELIELIASGEAVALVGAGSSISAGYDSWTELLVKLEKKAASLHPPFTAGPAPSTPRDYLLLAQRIRDHINLYGGGRQAFHNAMGRVFARVEEDIRRSLTPFHHDLVNLPFRAFLTTNYDTVLEVALAEAHGPDFKPEGVALWNGDSRKVGPAVRSLAIRGPARHVLHLHGLVNFGASVILCADDYAEAYGLPDLAVAPIPGDETPPLPPYGPPTPLFLLLSGLLSTRRVVFVGFSLDDLYFTEVLKRVSDLLWEWDTSVHFAILPIKTANAVEARARARWLKTELGIATVFYETDGRDHSGRDLLISRVRHEAASRNAEVGISFAAVPSGLTAGATASAPTPTEDHSGVPHSIREPSTQGTAPVPQSLDWVRINNASRRARVSRREA